jgi:hypothetical protein
MQDDTFWHWFAGFAAGEGSFTVRREEDKRVNFVTYRPAFSILLRADERPIVEEIAERIGRQHVRIKDREARTNPAGINSKPGVFMDVRSKAGCQRIVEIFDAYPLRAKKQRDFEVWRQIVLEQQHGVRGNRWNGPADKSRLEELAKQLVDGRKFKAEVAA